MGDSNPNVYEEWEWKVLKYSCNFSNKEVLKLIVLEFKVMLYFGRINIKIKLWKGKKPPVSTWGNFRNPLIQRFMPTTCKKDLILQLIA